MLPAPQLPDEDRRLRRLEALAVLDTPAEDTLDAFTRLAAAVTGMPIALVSLVDRERQWFKSAVGLPQGAQTPRDVSFCGHAIAGDGIFEIEDAPRHPDFADNALVTGEPRVVHYAGMPLRMPDGEKIGTVCLIDHKPGRLTAQERRFLENLAPAIVQALLVRETEAHRQRNDLLSPAESLAEFSPVGLFATDASGAVVHGNAHWLHLLGLHDLADGLGWAWTRVVDAADLHPLLQEWEQGVAERRGFEFELRTRPADGPRRWLRVRLSPSDRTASRAAFVGAITDITETRGLQLALQERNEVLESIIDHLPCGLAVFDRDLKLVTRNTQAATLLDLPPHLLTPGTDFATLTAFQALRGEFGPGDDAELTRARLARATSEAGLHEKRTAVNGTVLDLRSGRMAGGGQVQVYTDITAEKRAARAHRRSEQRLALALRSAGLGLWEFEPQAGLVHLSESWSRFFGFAPQARSVRLEQMADLAPAYATEACQAELLRLLKGEIEHMHLEHEMLNAQGEQVWVATRAQVVERDAAGRAVYVVGTTKDITTRRQAQAELAAAVQRADDANRAKADFLATMSHEIRTPINGVIGLARMLEDAALPARERGYVRMVNSCANTLLALVNDVLDFSKIEAGQMELDTSDTDLHGVVQELQDVFRTRAEEKRLGFSVHLDPQLPRWVRIDGHRLRQVLLNLLGNALKFTSNGGFSLQINARDGSNGRRLHFKVLDTGIGISPDGQAKLFQRYAQAEASTSRRFQGSGLGLSIARDLARLMGGDITVNSVLGVGSTFTIELPLVEIERPAQAAASGLPAAAAQVAPGASSILLVEDNTINQLVARTLLNKLGYTDVTIAADGQQAVLACQSRSFDLVLMDCQMPVLDGFAATRVLRAKGFDRPIVALTAGAVAEDREACLSCGMDDYLAKPIDAAKLASCAARWLEAGVSGAPAPAPIAALH